MKTTLGAVPKAGLDFKVAESTTESAAVIDCHFTVTVPAVVVSAKPSVAEPFVAVIVTAPVTTA